MQIARLQRLQRDIAHPVEDLRFHQKIRPQAARPQPVVFVLDDLPESGREKIRIPDNLVCDLADAFELAPGPPQVLPHTGRPGLPIGFEILVFAGVESVREYLTAENSPARCQEGKQRAVGSHLLEIDDIDPRPDDAVP